MTSIEARQNFHAQKLICIVGVSLFIIKLIAWGLTHSVAILTDVLESVTNVMSSFMGLYCLYFSALPKDRNHPYGHGKVELISAAIEGTLIVIVGLFIIIEAGARLTHPSKALARLDLGIILLAGTAAINYFVGHLALKTGVKNRSLALVASGKHLQTDTYSTLGVIVGLALLYLTGWTWIDAVIAILFALLILYTGLRILRSATAGIIDESDQTLMKELIGHLDAHRKVNWVDLHNLRIIKYGSALHVDCHLTVPWYFTVREAHDEMDALAALVRERFGQQVEFFVHVDACTPKSCELCAKENCTVRKAAFRRKISWTLHNTAQDSRHDLAGGNPLEL